MTPAWSGDASGGVLARIVVEGDLVLETPARLGGGDAEDPLEMPLLVDPLDGRTPMLTGASLAGALRACLRRCGVGEKEDRLLFGPPKREDQAGEQGDDEAGRLIVEDSLGEAAGREVRWGVAIDPRSRTAAAGKLYDAALWPAGTRFPLRFELQVREEDDEDLLRRLLATGLYGLQTGEIALGARKTRGFGRVRAQAWRVRRFDLRTPEGLLDWIDRGDRPLLDGPGNPDIAEALAVPSPLPVRRDLFRLEARFRLAGSLLIRSDGDQGVQGPNATHLSSRRAANEGFRPVPVLSGTSLAGALRARALRIARTLEADGGRPGCEGFDRAARLVGDLFGPEIKKDVAPRASRVLVRETVVEGGRSDLVQTRVSIDRFTGGAREARLFSEQPLFGDGGTEVAISLQIERPEAHEVGLLLLLLKDLWTGDLPLGGESAVGRGRLDGQWAALSWERRQGEPRQWTIRVEAEGSGLKIDGDPAHLEQQVEALVRHLEGRDG